MHGGENSSVVQACIMLLCLPFVMCDGAVTRISEIWLFFSARLKVPFYSIHCF